MSTDDVDDVDLGTALAWQGSEVGFPSRIGATLAGLMADKPLIVSDLRD